MGVGGGEGEQRRSSGGEMMAISSLFNEQQNPIQQLQVKFKEVEVSFKTWLSKQSIPVEAAVVSTMSGVQGAFIGGLMGTLSPEMPQTDPQAMASMKQAQALVGGPWVQARNFAAITGVNAGIACVMKRIRGKEDLESAVVAALGSGFAYSLVSQGLQGQPINAITTAAGFAVFQGIFFKASDHFGLQKYEKNFKKGLLTDPTLPLLTDSALRDVSIPPGPRLLILDHIQRDPEIKGKRGK
ncbi:hypothetical protein DY000_02055651 [Brassica cretica]|uniref:SAM domain-containing protein n=1 Tax=Brassica cretica TaxID=69181 RepID=A0ABQ7A4I8_BRACR|nr:hypothetical protein DY000_02055651 [Brassica cretica]